MNPSNVFLLGVGTAFMASSLTQIGLKAPLILLVVGFVFITVSSALETGALE